MARYLIEFLLKFEDIEKIKQLPKIQLVKPIISKDSLPVSISMCMDFKKEYNISPIGFLIYDSKTKEELKRIYFNSEVIDNGYEVGYPSEDIEEFVVSKDFIIPLPHDKCEFITINI